MNDYCIVYRTSDGCEIEATLKAETKRKAEKILMMTTPDLEEILESYKI